MTTSSGRMKEKGQITVPVELRRTFELHAGSRLIFEDRGDHIAMVPVERIVDRTAAALREFAENAAPMSPDQIRAAAASAIVEENLATIRQVERDHAGH
jgi:AbrB family looped-hinge helix DNA binding protein